VKFEADREVKKKVDWLINKLDFVHVDKKRVFAFRSYGSKSRARARIWSFPKIWQMALCVGPSYVIEVVSENFDNLSDKDKIRVLIHELLHIPKTFSGALLGHKTRYTRLTMREVNKYYKRIKE